MAREILCISEYSFVFSRENVIINNNQVRYSFDRLHGTGDHMTESALEGLSGSVLNNETFNDDGRAFLAIERGMNFFFQAEDGIRDWSVTGVQTCALPI